MPEPVTDETINLLKDFHLYYLYDYQITALDSAIALLESLPRTKDGVRVSSFNVTLYSIETGKLEETECVIAFCISSYNDLYYHRKNAEEALREGVDK